MAPPGGAGPAGGFFVSLEGVDGAGKSTQARRLAEELRRSGRRVALTRDPGGTRAGRAIRDLLLDRDEPLAAETEIALFFADRAQNLAEVIRPALARGEAVVGDRFTDSTLAYQAYGRGLARERILAVDRGITGGFRPHLTLVLDLPAEAGLARLERRVRGERPDSPGRTPDRIEREAAGFHERVRRGFLALAEEQPERIVVVPADRAEDEVFAAVRGAVEERFGRFPR